MRVNIVVQTTIDVEEHDVEKVENIIKIDINHDVYMHDIGSWSVHD